MEIKDRFWVKIKKENGGCWIWTAYKNKKGYGIFQLNGPKKAHRISYELLVGPIRRGFEIDHLCKNKACVNPTHLEQVTTRMNTHRATTTLAYKNASKTHCPQGHAYLSENLLISSNGYNGARRCRTCKNAQERIRYHKNKRAL